MTKYILGMLFVLALFGGLFAYAANATAKGQGAAESYTSHTTNRATVTNCEALHLQSLYRHSTRNGEPANVCGDFVRGRESSDRRRKPEHIDCRHLGESHNFKWRDRLYKLYLLQRKINHD